MKIIGLIISFFVLGLTATAQNILVNGKLPNDLQIKIDDTGTVQFANYTRSIISVDGTVGFEYTRRGLPVQNNYVGLLILKGQKPTKLPTKKDKLSKKQLLELAQAIETSTFFDMKDRYDGNPSIQAEGAGCVNHAAAKAISVTANQKTKHVYFFLGCGYGEYEPLKKFLTLYQQIEKMVSGVRVTEIKPSVKP